MSKDYQKIVKEALLNNSFDDGVMSTSLKQTWFNSYSYLLYLQQSNIEYEELCYFSGETISREPSHIGDLYVNKSLFACFDVDYDLIHVAEREEYRRSEFYLKDFTIQDIMNNQSIFTKMPIVMIDDKVIWDYKIKIIGDCTTFTLPFKKSFVITAGVNEKTHLHEYINHKIQVLIVETSFYDRYVFNKNTMNLNQDRSFTIYKDALESACTSNAQSIILNKYKVSTYDDLPTGDAQKEYRVATSKASKMFKNISKMGTMFCSIHFPNTAGNDYELGTMMIPLVEYDDKFIGHLTTDIYTDVMSSTNNFYISFFFVLRLMCHEFYNGMNYTVARDEGADLLCIEEDDFTPYACPIPVENFMVFKRRKGESGFILEHNTQMLELHYPNIYRIKDEKMNTGEVYRVFYFYYNQVDLKYTVMFDFYFRFLYEKFNHNKEFNISMEKIINDLYYQTADFDDYTEIQKEEFYKIFKKIYDYKFYHHQYGETDFLDRYIKIAGNEDMEPFEYKVNTMKDWIKVQPWVLRDYVLEQKKLGSNYHLFTNTLNLQKRIRYNTYQELGDKDYNAFSEPMYVFAFNNTTAYPDSLDMRVFVDGLMCGAMLQFRKLYIDYIYLPVRLVTNDSYIEIEIFPSYKLTETLNFKSKDEVKEITLLEMPDDVFPTIADLNYKEEKEGGLPIDPSNFEITTHTERGDILVSGEGLDNPVEFTRLKTYSVRVTNDILLNEDINFSIKKYGENIRFTVEKDGYLILKFVGTEIFHNFDTETVRVYDEEGRLLPQCLYKIYTFYENPYMYFFKEFKKDDKITIDFTPYHYKEICHIENIRPDTTLIDLSDYIDKPFDVRYYDIYMNGRKLSLNNVIPVTPNQITLVNLHSIYNLDIYERERDWEFFGLDYHTHMYYFTFTDLIESGAITEEEKNKVIEYVINTKKDAALNIYPNTNDEEKQERESKGEDTVDFCIYYFGNLIPKTYINPSTRQESNWILDKFFNKVRDYYKLDEKTMMLNPDTIIPAEVEKTTMAVFPVGHLDDVSDEILAEEVIIKDDNPIVEN